MSNHLKGRFIQMALSFRLKIH